MCLFVGRLQIAWGHELLLVCLTQRLHMVVCHILYKVACLKLRPLEGTCLLLTLHLMKPLKAQQEEHVTIVDLIHNSFPRSLYDTSLLPRYAEHDARQVWKRKVCLFTFMLHLFHTDWVALDVDIYVFLQELEAIKSVNHARKILNLGQNAYAWFQYVVHYSRLRCLCATRYMTINHGMLGSIMER